MYSHSLKNFYEIPGFPGYLVSKNSQVLSLKWREPRLMTPTPNSHGYFYVTLRDGQNRQITKSVHTIMALVFFKQKSTRLLQVNHIDGDKSNNKLENLEIISAKDNAAHAIRVGLRNTIGEKNPSAKLSIKQAKLIRKLANQFKHIYGYRAKLAKKYGITKELVYAIQKNEVWAHLK